LGDVPLCPEIWPSEPHQSPPPAYPIPYQCVVGPHNSCRLAGRLVGPNDTLVGNAVRHLNALSLSRLCTIYAYTNVTDRQQTDHATRTPLTIDHEQIEQSFTVYSEYQIEKSQRLRTLWFDVSFSEVDLLFSCVICCDPTRAPRSLGPGH